MTIEKVHTSSEAKASVASETKVGKNKPPTSGDPMLGGFSVLMSELEGLSESTSAPTPAFVDSALSPAQGDPASVLLVAPLGMQVPNAIDDTVLDAATWLAQSAKWTPTLAEDIVGNTVDIEKLASGVVNAGGLPRSAPSQALLQASQGLVAGHATQILHKLAVNRTEQALQQNQCVAVSQENLSGAGISLDMQALQVFEKREALPFLPSSVETTHVATTAAIRREERGQDPAIFKMKPIEPILTPMNVSTGMAMTSISAVTVFAPTPEAYVAEQVKYWISADIKNAEMKLDGLGGGPVEVSISMQGNEAQVAFRTDEVRAREALENASVHLKEMLQREGLVLSGVSVGMADTGGGGAQERKGHGAVQQISVVPESLLRDDDLLPIATRVSGRTLDLFV